MIGPAALHDRPTGLLSCTGPVYTEAVSTDVFTEELDVKGRVNGGMLTHYNKQ